MKVILSTSTKNGAFAPTETVITFRVDDGPIQEQRFEASEQSALLAWATAQAFTIEQGGLFTIFSAPNALSGPFEKGWIVSWRTAGFRGKPKRYRPDWKAFDEILAERQLKLQFVHPSPSELRAALSVAKPPPAPGTPLEDPWRRHNSTDEMLHRALKKH